MSWFWAVCWISRAQSEQMVFFSPVAGWVMLVSCWLEVQRVQRRVSNGGVIFSFGFLVVEGGFTRYMQLVGRIGQLMGKFF